MDKQVKIAMVDDHLLFVEGVCTMLTNQGYIIVKTGNNVPAGFDIISNHDIDILISDIQMPDQRGNSLVKWTKENYPWIKIIVLSMCDDRATVSELASLGINAYVLKSAGIHSLYTAIERVMRNQFYIDNEIADVLMAKTEGDIYRKKITNREEEIVRLMLKELSNKEISSKLFISERTVEAHRRNIYRKTNTNTIVGLLKWAIENKVITLSAK